ncbi:MAG: RNA polymerase sigma factor RpoD/SigA [Treponema sp.]|jgi:RNA polymerase primary sigma factor|nr:RNA polymerase sigma factor RpoD/SigA [Treponema sp.]
MRTIRGEKKITASGDDGLQAYFKQVKRIPLLTFEEELALSKRIQQGDTAARQKLIEANLRLVVKVVQTYLTLDVPFMDMVQEGNLGLIHAAEKYSHEKNVRFSTYANWWIRQFISRFLADKRRIIRLPYRKEATFRKIRNAYHLLSQSLMQQPNTKAIAKEVGIPVKDVEFIITMTNSLVSLDTEGDEESPTVLDIHEDYTYNPEREFFQTSALKDTLQMLLNRLKDQEKRILMYRYELKGHKKYSLRTIGDKMGMSAETVRQIEMKALKTIRVHAEEFRDSLYGEAI